MSVRNRIYSPGRYQLRSTDPYWRRQQDLNLRTGQARLPVFQTGPFSLLGMPPYGGSSLIRTDAHGFADRCLTCLAMEPYFGGSGRIRTHARFPVSRFSEPTSSPLEYAAVWRRGWGSNPRAALLPHRRFQGDAVMTAPAPRRIHGDPCGTRTHICSLRGCRPDRLDEGAIGDRGGARTRDLLRDRQAC